MDNNDKLKRRYALEFSVDPKGKAIGTVVHVAENRPLFWAGCETLVTFFGSRAAFGFDRGEIARRAGEYLSSVPISRSSSE